MNNTADIQDLRVVPRRFVGVEETPLKSTDEKRSKLRRKIMLTLFGTTSFPLVEIPILTPERPLTCLPELGVRHRQC